jgi:hypothetical protein
MTDSPTLSASASNYATLDPNAKASSITLSDGNLKSVDASGSFTVCVFATQTVSNKCYWEFQITNVGVNNARGACGVLPSNYTPTTLANDTLVAGVTALGANSVGMCPQVSAIYQNGATTGISTGVWVANDIVMMAYDNGKLWMGRNGTWANSGNPAAGTGEVASGLDTSALPVICNRNSQTWIANFGQRPFAYTPPTGFVGLNTYNLPDSTIKKGNSYMDATLWTGDGSAQTITNAGAFKPDLVWWKNRNSTRNNLVFDSIRGVGNYIQTNATTAEATDAQMLTSFNSDGFTHGTSANGATSAETYVAWQWNASTAVTPTYKTSQLSTQATNSTTISVTVPTYTTGDLLVMVVNSGGSSATTWTTPSGWTAGPNNGTAQAVFWRIAVSEPASYTVTQSTSNTADGTILVFSNASFDTAGAPAGNSTTITPSAITVANNNSTILYVVYDSAASRSPTAAPTGYTTIISDGDATSPCQFVYRLSGVASGSYTGPTVTTSGNMRCFTIAIKPSSAVLNTTGSITSTVSANTTAGFSIVTYTGTGANATVGHGLGVAPKLVIIKDRTNGTNDWPFYHTSGGPLNILYLNSTSAYITVGAAGVWNSTAPSSTVFSIGTNGRINTSSNNYVAYCWAEIEGFSKFGSYTGNGSANGPVVYLGFRPKYLMIKQTNTTANWHLIDSSRNLYNVVDLGLKANLTDAESAGSSTLTPYIDFLANGFKLRTSQNQTNASGGNFIYVAFAENPFKNSLAR